MSYPPLDEQIKEFPIYWLSNKKLLRLNTIKSVRDYSHHLMELHHYIKEQHYYRYPEKYKGMQRLILLSKKLHSDLHSAMSDERFFERWNVERDSLIYRHRIIN